MKNLKIGAAVLAMLFVAFSAFTTKKSTTTKLWFEFVGEEVTLEELVKPVNYVYADETEAPCDHSEQICGIFYDGTTSSVSSALATDGSFATRLQTVLSGGTDEDIVEKEIE
jgi:hypothetical protein